MLQILFCGVRGIVKDGVRSAIRNVRGRLGTFVEEVLEVLGCAWEREVRWSGLVFHSLWKEGLVW